MICLRQVSKRFPNARSFAVADLSLEVAEGEIVVLVGPSGCGKTTTLKMINRLIEPTSGSILLNGREVLEEDPVELRRGIGYVIQSVGLLPHRTVAENMGTVCRLLGWDRARIRKRVEELAEMLELAEELLDRYPAELSGGQRQRVGVARALAADPPVMLMDEPFGAVDPIVRGHLQDQLLQLQGRIRKTIVLVTHDIDEAIKMADRIAILNVGGVLEQYASPEQILRSPANEFVSEFVGAERGLKRLALVDVAAIELEPGPVVAPSTDAEEARRVVQAHGLGWTSVVEDKTLLGWVDLEALEGCGDVHETHPRPFAAHLTAESSLREALDAMVTSETMGAVVVGEGGQYVGLLTIEHISRQLDG